MQVCRSAGLWDLIGLLLGHIWGTAWGAGPWWLLPSDLWCAQWHLPVACDFLPAPGDTALLHLFCKGPQSTEWHPGCSAVPGAGGWVGTLPWGNTRAARTCEVGGADDGSPRSAQGGSGYWAGLSRSCHPHQEHMAATAASDTALFGGGGGGLGAGVCSSPLALCEPRCVLNSQTCKKKRCGLLGWRRRGVDVTGEV